MNFYKLSSFILTAVVGLAVSSYADAASGNEKNGKEKLGTESIIPTLYYAGTSNGWDFEQMNFDVQKAEWYIDVELTGQGDSKGPQRFRIFTKPTVKAKNYGVIENGYHLCENSSKCGDIAIPEVGSYRISISESTMNWSIVKNHTEQPVRHLKALYYAGTTNGWSHDAMTFDPNTKEWKIVLKLTGDGDEHGPQRFKVTTTPDWHGEVFGSDGLEDLCSIQGVCNDVWISEVGTYELAVNETNMHWSLTKSAVQTSLLKHLYFSGTTNNWTHSPMSYDSSTGFWKIILKLNGVGDESGPQRFKLTTTPDWNGKVFGSDGRNELCSVKSVCKDVQFNEVGTYELLVDESTMAWELNKIDGPSPSFTALYYTGSSNRWQYYPLDYDQKTRSWNIVLFLNGKGDAQGKQRFRITTKPDRTGIVFGTDGQDELCTDPETCIDVPIEGVGTYILTINDQTKLWSVSRSEEQISQLGSLYYAGTSNGWNHEPMTFDKKTGMWGITLNLNGMGDDVGFQRFKVTSSPDWNGDVYGSDGRPELCALQSVCGDVLISEAGTYNLYVEETSMRWRLEKATKQIAQHDVVSYVGTSNNWKKEPLSFDEDSGNWTASFNLSGNGDETGPQRFRILVKVGDKEESYGNPSFGHTEQLCSNPAVCGDIQFSSLGRYLITVNDATLTWKIEPQAPERENVAPIADFSVDVDNNNKVTFRNFSDDPDGNKLTYLWNFGDGETSKDVDVVHSYLNDGIYTVTLTVFDGEFESTATQDVDIQRSANLSMGRVKATHDKLYYVGTSNDWKPVPMKYESSTGIWTIDLNLSGNGDEKGPQRFKITTSEDGSGKSWGAGNDRTLCDKENVCDDVYITEIGPYQLQVSDLNMSWKLVIKE